MVYEATTFYTYQIVWYIFATIISFVAALLFWDKGGAVIRGKVSGTWKISCTLTGAGAIFLGVFFIFLWMNPVFPLMDNRRLIIIQSNKSSDIERGRLTDFTIKINKKDDFWKDFDPDHVAIEMVPVDYFFKILKTPDGKGLCTTEKIPKGNYLVTLYWKDQGKYKRTIENVK